jgi:hypothetical protein
VRVGEREGGDREGKEGGVMDKEGREGREEK